MKRLCSPSEPNSPVTERQPSEGGRTRTVGLKHKISLDGMTWKRMFSFRAAAAQDRTAVTPSTMPRSERATAAVVVGASTSAGATAGTSSLRSRERSFSEGAASRHDGSSTVSSLNASVNDPASRRRSLDLTASASEPPQVRASYSAESLLEFNHPDDSESTLSLSLSYHSLHGHERPRTPLTVAASSKSADMLPRPPPKAKPKRHVNTPFPYFVTPLVLTTANPYVMPPTPPSSPTNTKPGAKLAPPHKLTGGSLPRGTAPPARTMPAEELQHSTQEPIDEPPPAPTTIFEKITGAPRKRLVSRPSADGLAFASSASTLASFPNPRPAPAHFDDRPTSSYGTEAARASRPSTGTGADSISRPLASAGADERVKIAVTKKARVDGEVGESRHVGEVLPRLRMLRAR